MTLFYQLVNGFFRQAGLISEEEQMSEWESKGTEETGLTKLTQIRGAKHRTALMEMYIPQLITKYKLTPSEQVQLRNTIHFGLMLHAFPQITLTDTNLIKDIEGLFFNETTREFYFERPRLKKKKYNISLTENVDDQQLTNKYYITQWMKYIKRMSRCRKTYHERLIEHLSLSATLQTPILVEPIIVQEETN